MWGEDRDMTCIASSLKTVVDSLIIFSPNLKKPKLRYQYHN